MAFQFLFLEQQHLQLVVKPGNQEKSIREHSLEKYEANSRWPKQYELKHSCLKEKDSNNHLEHSSAYTSGNLKLLTSWHDDRRNEKVQIPLFLSLSRFMSLIS